MSDIVAKLADGTELRFPAGTADSVVDTTVKNYLADPANQVTAPPQAQAPVAPTVGPEGAPIPPILKSELPPEPTTTTEALGHGIVKSILPSAAGLVAGATGATLGSVAGPVGTIAGGIGLGFTAAEKVAEIQDEFLKEHPKVANLLGVDPKQTLREELEHPYAAFTGQLIPNLAAMRPSGALLRSTKGLTEEAAKQLQARKIAAGVNALINSAITGGLETGQELVSGQELDPKKIAIAAGAGLAGQKETAIGRKLSLLGEKFVPTQLKGNAAELRRPEEKKPTVEVGEPAIIPSPELAAYDAEIAKAQESKKTPPKPTETTVAPETSHDTQAMMDELSGKEIPLDESQFKEEAPKVVEASKEEIKPIESIKEVKPKEEPTGIISETEKEFTPVGGRLINKADVEKLGTESKRALEQNLKEQEALRDKQLKTEAREEKFKEPPTQTLSAKLVKEGGISRAQKLDMLGETGKVTGYDHVFREKGGDLLTMVKDGKLDDYLPPDIRTTATPPDGLYDARPGYNYISDMIKTGEKVHTYDYEMAKLEHENMVYEKNQAKQQMTPNESARAAAAEVQGKEYMNLKPEEEIVPPLTKGPEVGTMEWLTEDNPPVHNLYEGNKSLKVEMNKLKRDIESGRASDTEVKDAVLNILETTKKTKEERPLVRGPEHIKARLLEAKRNGTLAPKAVDMAEWLINKNPEIMRESAISIKEEPQGNKKAGAYDPAQRLIQLFNHIGDEKTPVHESLHSVERLLPEDIRSGIRKAWLNNLFKEYHKALKGKDENLKQYFKNIVDYHTGENPIGDKVAKDIIQKGLIDRSNYQFLNPSEFWAIRGSDIVADRFNAEISKSTVNRLKQWIKEFIQKLKDTFGLKSDAPIIRALDSLAKSDGKFKTQDMLAESAEYAAQPPKNFKGQEVISQWNTPEESKVDDWLYKLQDKHIDAKRVQQLIENAGHKVEDNWNFYEKEMLYHGRTASGIRKFLLKEVLPVTKEMQKLKVTPEEIHNYLANRHAEERNIQMNKLNPGEYDPKTNTFKPSELKDRGSGIHTNDARKYLADLDPVKKQHLEEIAKYFDKMVKGTQGILMNSGAETGDTIRKWNQTYKHYVPLMRKEDPSSKTQGMIGTGQGYASRGSTSKRALGSLKEHEDILGNLIAQRERAIIRAEKIRVGRALYGLSIQSPNPDFWLPINPDAIRNRKQAVAELTRLGIPDAKLVVDNLMAEPKERYLKKVKQGEGVEPDEDFDFDSGLPVNQSKEVVDSKVNVMARYHDNVFPVRINGKDRFIFFNKNNPRAMRMAQAIKNLDVEELGTIENIAGHYTRWFKNVNTQYNPVFGLKNFIRDYSAGNLNLTSTPINGAQAQITADMMPAMRGILEVHRAERKGITDIQSDWGKFYQRMRDEGFQTGYRDSLIRNQEEMQIINHLLEQMNDRGVKANAKAAFYHIAGGLTDFNDVMENSIRLAAAKAALDRGLSPQKAAVIAKNITVNFDKKGAKTREIGALYAFFNPAVQGTERIYQTLKGPAGKAIIGGGILAGMIQAVMMAAAGYEDNDPPEFTRQKAFVIPMPDGHYLPIPYPQGYNVLPNVGRQVMDFIIHGGKNPGKHIADLTGAMMDSLSPLGTVGWTMQSIAPTALDPLAALAENKDAFARPIAKTDRATAPTPGYTRSRDTVSMLGQGISEFLNWASGGDKYVKGAVSPTGDQIDYLGGQIGGGLYREISKAAQYVKSLVTGEDVPSYRVPIAGQFHGKVGEPAAIANKFYENVTRMTDHENTIKGLRQDKLPKDQYMTKHPEARLWNKANSIENQVNGINKQKRLAIKNNKPKEVIQRFEDKKTRIMQKFNDEVKALNPD